MNPEIQTGGRVMQNIKEFMADDHRQCDDFFVAVEKDVAKNDWQSALGSFSRFHEAMLRHFAAEESVLFPAFEAQTGIAMGPTQVMRGEHIQLRELMASAEQALFSRDGETYAGEAETLLIMMQQHNMKEENVLYPMCDQHLLERAGVLLPILQGAIHPSRVAG
jgi:hemerythrin-like domain-containing protein